MGGTRMLYSVPKCVEVKFALCELVEQGGDLLLKGCIEALRSCDIGYTLCDKGNQVCYLVCKGMDWRDERGIREARTESQEPRWISVEWGFAFRQFRGYREYREFRSLGFRRLVGQRVWSWGVGQRIHSSDFGLKSQDAEKYASDRRVFNKGNFTSSI